MAYLRDNLLAYAKWQEQEGLLVLNNSNDYAGAGSYGFTTERPTEHYAANGPGHHARSMAQHQLARDGQHLSADVRSVRLPVLS